MIGLATSSNCGWAGPVHAQDKTRQDKTLRLAVPFSAGGGVDALARLLARKMQADLGETVIVDNKPGAGGNLGLDWVAAAPPDGRKLVIITNSLVINPILTPSTKLDEMFAPGTREQFII